MRNPQACEGVMGAMLHFKETISVTNETGCATITDCTYTKETITISKSGFCNTTIIKRIDNMPSDPVEKETVDLRPIERNFLLVTDQKFFIQLTIYSAFSLDNCCKRSRPVTTKRHGCINFK